jgi:predicted site-specific integrase-resolvase
MLDAPAGLVRRLDACVMLGIVPRTAHEWSVRGYGPQPRRIGGRVYYLKSEIDAFLQEVRASPSVVA